MTQVEAQEKASEKAIHKYIYHVTSTEQDLDSHGNVKKTNTAEREDFWVNDTYISKVLSRDGKPVSGGEAIRRLCPLFFGSVLSACFASGDRLAIT